MSNLSISLLLFCLPPSLQFVQAQVPCSNAIHKQLDSIDSEGENLFIGTGETWFFFQASVNEYLVGFSTPDTAPTAAISSVSVYSGPCSNLSLVYHDTTMQDFGLDSLNTGTVYYIKVLNTQSAGYIKMSLKYFQIRLRMHGYCDNTDCHWACGNSPVMVCPDVFIDCLGRGIEFNVYSTIDPDDYLTFNFGDGTPVVNPTASFFHTYLLPGTYTIELTCYNSNGTLIAAIWQTIVIIDQNSAGISISASNACPGQLINLSTSPGWSLSEIIWGDGQVESPAYPNNGMFSHAYGQCGSFQVEASLWSECCGEPTSTDDIAIEILPNFSYSKPCLQYPVQFNGLVDCNISSNLQWIWHFGDNTSGSGQNPVHTYVKPGNFTVTLEVRYLSGEQVLCVGVITKTVSVLMNMEPVIKGNNNRCDEFATYEVEAPDPDNFYEWEIPAGSGTFTANGLTSISGIGLSQVEIQWVVLNVLSSAPVIPIELLVTCHFDYINQDPACFRQGTKKIFPCCFLEPGWPERQYSNDEINAIELFTGEDILINGTLTLNAPVTFSADINSTPVIPTEIFMGPEASIINNSELQLEMYVTIRSGCQYMWDGIYNNDASLFNTSDIESQEIIIKNSLFGIVPRKGSTVTVNRVTFQDNDKGITIKDYFDYQPSGIYNPIPVWTSGNTFENTNSPGFTLTLPPKTGQQSFCGIQVMHSAKVRIGANSFNPNYFSNTLSGVWIEDAQVVIENNVFTNTIGEHPSLEIWPVGHAAILARATSGKQFDVSDYIPPLLVVGASPTTRNEFLSCANNTIFTYRYTGKIERNYFHNSKVPVFLLDPQESNSVYKNRILSSDSLHGQGGRAIDVENVYASPGCGKVIIWDNHISGFQYGIRAVNLTSFSNSNINDIYIRDNTIRFYNPTNPYVSYSNPRFGIDIQHCDGIFIESNRVIKADPPLSTEVVKDRGIWISRSKGALAIDNEIVKMGSGIYTTGDLMLTQFVCNTLDNCYHGFYFAKDTWLSDQDLSTWASIPDLNNHNDWQGLYGPGHEKLSQYYVGVTYGIINTAPIYWYYFSGLGSNYLLDIIPGNPLHSLIIPIQRDNATEVCAFYDQMNFTVTDTIDREAKFGDILRNENTFSELQDQYLEYEKEYLYHFFASDSSLLYLGSLDDIDYQALFDSLKTSFPGFIDEVYKKIETREFDAAAALAYSMGTNNAWQENRRKTLQAYIDRWLADDFEFSADEKSMLEQIAYSSPYVAGDGVYSARVLLNINPQDELIPYLAEDHGNPTRSGAPFRVYPNPANGTLVIENPGVLDESISLTLSGILGNEILRLENLDFTQSITINTSQLPPGLYFYCIKSPRHKPNSGKIVLLHE